MAHIYWEDRILKISRYREDWPILEAKLIGWWNLLLMGYIEMNNFAHLESLVNSNTIWLIFIFKLIFWKNVNMYCGMGAIIEIAFESE